MGGKSGVVRSIAVLLISAIMISLLSFEVLFNSKGEDFPFVSASLNIEENIQSQSGSQKPSESVSSVQSNVSSNNTASKEVSASADAKGKILEQFISPNSASLSYNNVYLKNSTGLNIDIKSLLKSGLGFKLKSNSQPQVLIMHTHTTESFMLEDRNYYTGSDLSRRTNEKQNMVALGEIVAKKLNSAGIKTIHDKTKHDYPAYNGSYTRAADTICSYLKKYPSIKIVIDMHRDAISSGKSDKVKLCADINGKKAAQVMLVMGSQSGTVKNFPKWKENLKLALKIQQTFEVMYPTLARPLSLTSKNYNESLTTGSILLEMGTDANTLEEAKYSAELVGNALVSVFNTLK